MEAPERIWASPEHPDENGYGGFWISSRVAPSVEYIRADLLDAHIGAVLAAAVLDGQLRVLERGRLDTPEELRALRPDALQALERVRREARAEAFEEVARLVDCGCHPEKKAVTLSFAPGHWRTCNEVNCGALEANAIRALAEAERGKP